LTAAIASLNALIMNAPRQERRKIMRLGNHLANNLDGD
jgi:hypothetical protein